MVTNRSICWYTKFETKLKSKEYILRIRHTIADSSSSRRWIFCRRYTCQSSRTDSGNLGQAPVLEWDTHSYLHHPRFHHIQWFSVSSSLSFSFPSQVCSFLLFLLYLYLYFYLYFYLCLSPLSPFSLISSNSWIYWLFLLESLNPESGQCLFSYFLQETLLYHFLI